MVRRRDFLISSLAIPLTACVTTSAPPSATNAAGIRSIAIISAFGSTLQLKYIGIVIFENTTQDIPFDDDLDGHVREIVAAQLAAGKFEIRDVRHTPADVVAPLTYAERTFGATSPIAERLKKVIPPGAVDAILFVGPRSTNLGGGGVYFEGVGLAKRANIFTSLRPVAFAYFRVVVFDGRTFENLGSTAGFGPSTRELPFDWPGGGSDTIGPAQRAQLRGAIFSILDQSLPTALSRMPLLAGRPAA